MLPNTEAGKVEGQPEATESPRIAPGTLRARSALQLLAAKVPNDKLATPFVYVGIRVVSTPMVLCWPVSTSRTPVPAESSLFDRYARASLPPAGSQPDKRALQVKIGMVFTGKAEIPEAETQLLEHVRLSPLPTVTVPLLVT